MVSTSNTTRAIAVYAGTVLDHHLLADGSTLVLHLSRSSTGSRRWVIGRTLRVLRMEAGAVYQTSRSKGVKVLWAREFDARSERASQNTQSIGQQVYRETVARARLEDAKQFAAEIMAAL